jgi:hypothetical protein
MKDEADLTLPDPDAERLYRVLKEYAVHEDGLMNTRMNWCLLINSFMLTGLAALANASDKLPSAPFLPGSPNLFLVVCFFAAAMGINLTVQSWRGVSAAEGSMSRLNDHWAGIRHALPTANLLPQLLGGVNSTSEVNDAGRGQRHAEVARHYPGWMLGFLCGAWVVIAFGSVIALAFPGHFPFGK